MVLLEELNVILGVGADGLGKTDRYGMKVVEIHGGVILEFAADDRVIRPLDFDKVGDTLASILLSNL